MEIERKLIKVGNTSLMIIIPKSICEGLKLKEGDKISIILNKLKGGKNKNEK